MNPRLFQWGCGSSNRDLYIYSFGTSDEQREMTIDGVGVVSVLGQTWNHLVVTWDFAGGGLNRAYLNGVQIAENESVLIENWLISGDINIGRKPCSAYDSWGGLVATSA